MSRVFLKFKRRLTAIRIVRAMMVGLSAGLALGGGWLILSKRAVIGFEPITSLYIGLGAFLIFGGLVFLLGGQSNKALAEELDSSFNLKARVQTMIAYEGEESDMLSLQRRDAQRALSKIPIRKYKFKKLWIYIIAMLLSAAVLAGGFVVEDIRGYVPPEEVIPFELSALQEVGLTELIKYVENSEMEKEFSEPIAAELRSLLERLREIKTQPEMLAAVEGSMTVIRDITYESSTATEVLNALWDSDDIYFRHLAKALDTSSVAAPDWGEFAEKMTGYAGVLMGDDKIEDGKVDENVVVGKELLKYAIDSMSLKLNGTLEKANVGEDDEICIAINQLFNSDSGGLGLLLGEIDALDDEGAREALNACFDANGMALYDAVSLNKSNANVGEYAMMRLSSLFVVPLPEFERPEFVKNGESIGGGQSSDSEKDDNNADGDGGVGEGATYGSKDLVLDPLTGEYVEYGKLIDKYYAIMYEKLEGDFYTEEQKEAIKKYFGLLYSGTEK